jgi:metal-responsive CopG/Arc/MetJ family transcriptional regulator
MMERKQVNIRLDRDLLDELDELASADRVDRSGWHGGCWRPG